MLVAEKDSTALYRIISRDENNKLHFSRVAEGGKFPWNQTSCAEGFVCAIGAPSIRPILRGRSGLLWSRFITGFHEICR